MDIRMSFGFICTDVDTRAVQRRPMPEEQVVIDAYRDIYKKALGHAPHGMHFLPFPHQTETVAVWLPLEEGGVLEELSWEERGLDRGAAGGQIL